MSMLRHAIRIETCSCEPANCPDPGSFTCLVGPFHISRSNGALHLWAWRAGAHIWGARDWSLDWHRGR